MKYRRDFVTNSSSSSYIVAFNNAEDMIKCLRRFVNKFDIEDEQMIYYKNVVFDILTNKITFSDALTHIKTIATHEAEMDYRMLSDKVNKYGNFDKWVNSSEYKKMCKEYVEKEISKFKKKVNPNGYISFLTYTDNYGFENARKLDKILDNVVHTVHIG